MQNDFYNLDYDRLNEIIKNSTNSTPVRNTRRKKRKPKGIKNLAKKAIVFVAIGASLTAGGYIMGNTLTEISKAEDIRDTVNNVVVENTNIYGYNFNEDRPYWDYNLESIASGILNENKEYDIDTRIYGCYNELNEYKKEEHMDYIFNVMSNMIESNPGRYTEDEIKACCHESFDEYLKSKNISLEEYTEIMEKVLRAYAKENAEQEQLDNLLDELKGGSR